MPTYNDLPDLSANGWPQNNVEVQKTEFRLLVDSLDDRAGSLPRDWDDYRNDVVVGRADGTGPSPAGDSDNDHADFRSLQVKGGMSYAVDIDHSITLNMTEHNGNDLFINSASAVALVLEPAGNPDEGIANGFCCVIRREGAGAVSVTIDSGFQNQHPDGYTTISRQGLAMTVKLKGTKLFLDGNLSA
jgi:hypothetical protein